MKEGVQFKRGTGSLSVQLQCQSEAVSAPENFRTKEISREKRIFFYTRSIKQSLQNLFTDKCNFASESNEPN